MSSFTVEHTGTRALDLPLNPDVQTYPFQYSDEELRALAPQYDDPTGDSLAWARHFVRSGAPTGTTQLLIDMNQFIRNTMREPARFDYGVQ